MPVSRRLYKDVQFGPALLDRGEVRAVDRDSLGIAFGLVNDRLEKSPGAFPKLYDVVEEIF